MEKSPATTPGIVVAALMIAIFIIATPATAGEISRKGRFIAYDNGTAVHTKTNLMWAAKDNGSDINWAGAKSYCEHYRGADMRTGGCRLRMSWRACMMVQLTAMDSI